MQLTLVTPPAEKPVTLAEVKAHLRISNTASDTLLASLIAAATLHLDGRVGYLRRAIVSQTWRVDRRKFPLCSGVGVTLPMPPLQSVTSVQYYDANDELQTLAAEKYRAVTADFIGRIELVTGESWPAVYDRSDAVRITFVAGYGDAAAVPDGIKSAILLHVAELYAVRGDDAGDAKIVPIGSRSMTNSEAAREMLLAPYRVMGGHA